MPTFVKEIVDVRAEEEEAVTFECQYSGQPTPGILLYSFDLYIHKNLKNINGLIADVVWYHDDKLMSNTEKVKISIQKNRSTCTIKSVSLEDIGVYICKATNEAGISVTKAQLQVSPMPEEKRLKINKAKQEKIEKMKEKVLLHKVEKVPKKVKAAIEVDEKVATGISHVETMETVKTLEKDVKTKEIAKKKVTIEQPVITSATASCKKIDDEIVVVKEEIKEIIKPKQTVTEPVIVHDIQVEGTIEEFVRDVIKKRGAKVTRHEVNKLTSEINETMQYIGIKEFAAGENPLAELAKIDFMVRHGITVNEVMGLYDANKFPGLKKPESQSALVQVIERKGHGTVISEILAEESVVSDDFLTQKLGFKALLRIVELKYVTVEEVITHLMAGDYKQTLLKRLEPKEVKFMIKYLKVI